ncbi:MAG TPA: type IV pili twitching motility protein PilT [Planctomycetes bacterium]|nr:type IV pili twitching motility protein PilT [Planctomycetota bacterium]
MTEIKSSNPLAGWLKEVAARNASDLHLGADRPPTVRVDGDLVPLESGILDAAKVKAICQEIVPENRKKDVEELGGADFSFAFSGDRYRTSVFMQRGSYALVCRRIPHNRLTFDEIGAPPVLRALADLPRGLVLVTGPTGSGKTTTLAALIHEMNKNRSCHIVTLEDPIEFFHASEKSVVNQREVGEDVSSFAEALRRVLRQDPDIIMLGEMRDLETTSAAITAAETGHLVLGTLHTTGAARTVDRIIDQFPREQQEQVRTQLSVSLQAVVSQVLLPRADGTGRVAAFEVMVRNSAIENHIRKGETFKVPSVMQTQKRIGMQLLDDHLLELVNNGTISRESALSSAQIPSDLAVRLDGENPS